MSADKPFLPSTLALQDVAAYRVPAFERAGLLRLDINERPDGAPDFVIDALRESLDAQTVATYPSYKQWHAEAAIAFGVAEDEVVPTNGADEGIRAIVDAHLLPGRALITHEPGFEMFAVAARLHGNPVVRVPFAHDGPAAFSFDPVPWYAALEDTDVPPGVVTLANPSNPTGAMVPRADIEKTLEAVTCPVIVDETYGAFLGESAVDLVAKHPHLFVLKSFSKVHGLAGLRIGAVISQRQNIDALRRLLNPYNVNRAAIAASIACMNHPAATDEHVASVTRNRTEFAGRLRQLRFPTGAEHSNFLLVHVGEQHAKITAGLREESVLIRDRHGSHPHLEGVVRVAIGTRGQMLRVAGSFRKHLRPPPRLDTLLLDMDGTLVDVRFSYRRAIEQTAVSLLRENGVDEATIETVNSELVDRFKRRGGLNNDWDCTLAICTELGAPVSRSQVIEAFQQRYRGTGFNGLIAQESWLLTPRAKSLMSRFSGLGVVTGRPRAEAEWALRQHAPDLELQLVAMEDTVEDKPHPAPILRGLRMAGGERAAYIGDSVDDMAAAANAGVFAIGVLAPGNGWQSGWPERLSEAGADVVFSGINEALAWLAGTAGEGAA